MYRALSALSSRVVPAFAGINSAFGRGDPVQFISGLLRRVVPRKDVRILILPFLLLLSGVTHALPEDNKEKVFIIADSSTYNYKTGINTFTGHVKVDQGTTHLLSDKLITKSNNRHKIQEAIAYGDQKTAHYWTIPKKGDPEVHAYAMIIKFYPVQSNVVLEKNVVVTQGENSFKGQVILYNRTDQTITVPASNEGHAVLVYNPNN